MKRSNIFFLLVFLIATQTAFGQNWKDEKYIDIEVLGWKVKVNTKLIEDDTSLLKKSLGLFGKELFDISHVLPPNALRELKDVTFWFEKETITHGYIGEYWHKDYGEREWLLKNGQNPDKAGGIEIVAGRYIEAKSTMEDWVILHELTHAFHDKVIGFGNKDIINAYKVTHFAGLYAEVRKGFDMHYHGYASTNYREYFAEISTAYFGHNSYYPYDRSDLRQYDDIGYKLVEKMWKVTEK